MVKRSGEYSHENMGVNKISPFSGILTPFYEVSKFHGHMPGDYFRLIWLLDIATRYGYQR